MMEGMTGLPPALLPGRKALSGRKGVGRAGGATKPRGQEQVCGGQVASSSREAEGGPFSP